MAATKSNYGPTEFVSVYHESRQFVYRAGRGDQYVRVAAGSPEELRQDMQRRKIELIRRPALAFCKRAIKQSF